MRMTLYRIGQVMDRYAVLNTLRLVTVHELDGFTRAYRIVTAQFRDNIVLARITITRIQANQHTVTVRYADGTEEEQSIELAHRDIAELEFGSLYVTIERVAFIVDTNSPILYALMPTDVSTSHVIYAGQPLFRFAFVADQDFVPDASLNVREITDFPFVPEDPNAGTPPGMCTAGTLYAAYTPLDAYNTSITLAFPNPFLLFATINPVAFYRLESPHLDWSHAAPASSEIAAFVVTTKPSRPLPNSYYFALSRGFAPTPAHDSSKTGLAYVMQHYIELSESYEEEFGGGPPSLMSITVRGAGRIHLEYSVLLPDLAINMMVEFRDVVTNEVLDSLSTSIDGRTIIEIDSNIAFEEFKRLRIIATLAYERGYIFDHTIPDYLVIYEQAEDALRSTERYVGPALNASVITGERWYYQDGNALLLATGNAVHLIYSGVLHLSWYDGILALPEDWSIEDGFTPISQTQVFRDLGGGIVSFAGHGSRPIEIDTTTRTIRISDIDQTDVLVRSMTMPYSVDYRGTGIVWSADFSSERRGFIRVFSDCVNMGIGT